MHRKQTWQNRTTTRLWIPAIRTAAPCADIRYGFDIDDEEKDWEGGYIAGYPHCNNFMISTTQGYQFNNFFFLGGGLGLLRYIDGKKTMMPIFAETSINLLNNKRVMPFL